jgi:hypothetical protein
MMTTVQAHAQALAFAREQRRFGRKESNVRGYTAIPGQINRTFTIVNVSEGGALLQFGDAYVPPATFRIEVGTRTLMCEVRHHGHYGVGVKFVRRREAAALVKDILLKPMAEPKAASRPETVVRPALPGVTCQSLRRAVLPVAVLAD